MSWKIRFLYFVGEIQYIYYITLSEKPLFNNLLKSDYNEYKRHSTLSYYLY